MNTYREWLSFLYEQLPMYQRTGASAIKKDLANIRSLCRELGDPQERIPTVHVAGTNGKGSVSHILSAIYQSAGLKVGLYTSPHYVDFRERIKIDGRFIAEHEVVTFCNRISRVLDDIRPSFFEITVAMAFDYFAAQEVDIAIVETGLGGRLDSTNIVTPLLSIITNISFDHQNLLGNSLEAIAQEKAGIIKHQVPVLIGEYQAEVANVFASTAGDKSSDLHYARDWASYECVRRTRLGMDCLLKERGRTDLPKEVHLGLHGDYQVANMCTALAGVSILSASDTVEIDLRSIRRGLAQVQQLSNMLGRWQVLQDKPMIVVDSGHNEAGFGKAMDLLEFASFNKLRMVIGFVKDKDISKMLSQVPGNAIFYWCAAALPRALASEELLEQARQFDLNGRAFSSVESALMQAKQEAHKDDFIFVGGSTFVVAEVLSAFQHQ